MSHRKAGSGREGGRESEREEAMEVGRVSTRARVRKREGGGGGRLNHIRGEGGAHGYPRDRAKGELLKIS